MDQRDNIYEKEYFKKSLTSLDVPVLEKQEISS